MKLNTYNKIVDTHDCEEKNTNNFVNGLFLYYNKFNLLYAVLEKVQNILGEAPVIIPSFDFDPKSNHPRNNFGEVKFKVRNKTNNEVEKVINTVLSEGDKLRFEYITDNDIHILRFNEI